MQWTLASTALILIAAVTGWGSHVPAASSAPASLTSRNGPTLASKTGPPFAYVAETCAGSSCSLPNGLVQMLGGPAITSGIEDPTTLALDGSGNLFVGNETASNQGDVSVYAPKSVNPLRTLSGITGVPKGLVADAAGRLFLVAQYKSGCCQ